VIFSNFNSREIQMNFKLKAVAAALALAAAVPAYADVPTLAATGNSDFILTVLDTSANISATFDLGTNYAAFNQTGTDLAVSNITASGTNLSWNLASNANYSTAWGQFLTAAAGSLSSIQYAVTAADNAGPSGAINNGARGVITTYVSPASLTTQQVATQAGFFDQYINNFAATGNSSSYQNYSTVSGPGSSVAASGTLAYALPTYNVNKLDAVGPTTMGTIGNSLGVVQETTGASSFAAAAQTVFGNGAQFTLLSNGALSYTTNVAAVPEADTWAMMLLGLGFMGFVARRRQA
jgi:hypothetical protein